MKSRASEAEAERQHSGAGEGGRGYIHQGFGPCEEELWLHPETNKKALEAAAIRASGGKCWFP